MSKRKTELEQAVRYKGEQALTQWARFGTDSLSTITDVELATLKIHLVIEGVLRYLLAARLDVSESVLEKLRLPFATLLELSLGGTGNSHLRGGIRALNDARNALSHQLESVDVQGGLEKFIREIGYMAPKKKIDWPTTSTEQLKVLRDAYTQAAYAIVSLAVAADGRLKELGA